RMFTAGLSSRSNLATRLDHNLGTNAFECIQLHKLCAPACHRPSRLAGEIFAPPKTPLDTLSPVVLTPLLIAVRLQAFTGWSSVEVRRWLCTWRGQLPQVPRTSVQKRRPLFGTYCAIRSPH